MTDTTTIQITINSWRALNARKRRPNETFDDVIQALMDTDSGERGDVEPALPATDHEFTDTDRRIVRFLQHDGRATAGLLVDELDRSETHVRRRLRVLRAAGEIAYRHEDTALYELA